MGFTLALLMAFMSSAREPERLSRQQLTQLIDAAQEANCRDVSFDYEGRQADLSKGRSNLDQLTDGNRPGPSPAPGAARSGGAGLTYNGTFSRRADGATLVDIYAFENPAGRAEHAVVAILGGTTEYSSRWANQKNAMVEIKKQGPLEYAGPGNFRQIWLADQVKKFADSSYVYEYEGARRLDGHECVVARFRLVIDPSTPKDQTVSLIFWVDLGRGGHVVRLEERYSGENLGRLTTVRLDRLDDGKGRAAWLPISGTNEVRMTSKNGRLVYLGEAISSETYDLLPVTLRLDSGLKDEVFSVKAKVGDAVSDQVRKARYEFGQYMVKSQIKPRRVTDAEVKANLDRMLKDSAVMAGELKASSPLRDGPWMLSHWPWVIAGLSTVGMGLMYHRQRRMRR